MNTNETPTLTQCINHYIIDAFMPPISVVTESLAVELGLGNIPGAICMECNENPILMNHDDKGRGIEWNKTYINIKTDDFICYDCSLIHLPETNR
jgi:hypothetical protein